MRQIVGRSAGAWFALTVISGSVLLVSSGPSWASSTSPSSLRCGSDQLSVVWRGTTGGLAGTFGDLFWVRNKGTSACVISGFPRVALYEKGKRLTLRTHDLDGHIGNDQMGVARGRRIPSIRLLPGGVASFWIFGNDVAQKCVNGNDLTISLKSLTGIAWIPVPKHFQSWTYCGDSGAEVNPLVPGVSGSDPSRPLSSEIMR